MTKAVDILDPVLAAVETETDQKAKQNGSDPSIVTMSTGIKFKVKPVSRQALAGISERYSRKKPPVPVTFIESKGREEENPDHPEYLDALYLWNMSLSMAVNNYLLLRGADVVPDSIPDNAPHFDSDEWKEEVEIIGGDPNNGRACYLEWIKVIAAPKNNYVEDGVEHRGDIAKLLYAIGRMSGTAQEDVDEAINNFRR
jgi:hypothetical protein